MGESSDRSISLARANLIVIVASFPVGISLYLFSHSVGRFSAVSPLIDAGYFLLFLAFLVFGITFHEVLHALGWIIAGQLPLRRVGFGFKLRTLSPYAHLRGLVTARVYRIGVLLPLVTLGVVPYLAGIVLHDFLVTIYGLFFILAAGGDVLVLWLLRGVPGNAQVEDHPTRAGFILYPPRTSAS